MSKVITRLLQGNEENHLLPFFWQHGEDEETLRKYVRVIHRANCNAFCIESRPHPDFCGPRWWHDMDVILDEAQKQGMQVWILDDSHFPTGYANGAMKNAPDNLCRQSIVAVTDGKFPPRFSPNMMEKVMIAKEYRKFDDDKIISKVTCGKTTWTVGLTRNLGYHRNYINMMSKKSVKMLIDAVYEKHWQHYEQYFGTVIAGFFSDEPELGNSHLYDFNVVLGKNMDYPFSDEVAEELEKSLGCGWTESMYLLFENKGDKEQTRRVRLAYMNAVTNLVKNNFSCQIGEWCREHGVMYIGHSIEDSGAHCRTGCGLGHYFRGLEGQDMAGIDDIGGQVMPMQEDNHKGNIPTIPRNSEFYHFMLARLASSAAAIEPLKKGRAMCEIFGNYGWAEGVHLEKYLADHFMVRGVNYFVPHAFSPKAFPDSDCPPHFYAHGHNPQYRHFGELMRYMNRVSTLISSGTRVADYALVYHAEDEWQGNDFMPNELMARKLEEQQISFDIIPRDYIEEPERYINRKYRKIIMPLEKEVPKEVEAEIHCRPISKYIRVCHIKNDADIYYLVNEEDKPYRGTMRFPQVNGVYGYDAWLNRLEKVESRMMSGYSEVDISIYPGKSKILIFEAKKPKMLYENLIVENYKRITVKNWERAICEGAAYPEFSGKKKICLPDTLHKKNKKFSGFVAYETEVILDASEPYFLEITEAHEGVELFVNGKSLGIQISAPYIYEITECISTEPVKLRIEVATTLERQCYDSLGVIGKLLNGKPKALSGITGEVNIYFS